MSSGAGMRDLVVDAMSARLVGVPATAEAHQWLDHTAGAVVHEHLPRALSAAELPAGHWFLPRLDLALTCSGLGGLPALADEWSRAILDSITASLAADAEWVHFTTDAELVAAMVVSAATGDTTHDWAWAQAGLPEDALTSPTATVVGALRLHPDVAAAGLVRAATTCGVAALDRALGESGWSAVADAIGAPLPTSPDSPPPATSRASGRAAGGPRAAALLEASHFGRLVLASRLRPCHATAVLWARLVVAEVEPALLLATRSPVDDVGALVEARLATRVPALGPDDTTPAAGTARNDGGAGDVLSPRPRRDAPSDRAPDRRPADPGRAGTDAAAAPEGDAHASDDRSPAPEQAPTEQVPSAPRLRLRPRTSGPGSDDDGVTGPGIHTRWAGLAYLLATAREAGLPHCVDEDPALAARGVRWSVWRAGIQLTHTGADDPAVLALCGLALENADLVLGEAPATSHELRAVAGLAALWRRTTLARLRAAPYGADDVPASAAAAWRWLVRRPGEVLATPGWIDVVLPLDAVDAAVRSAGLDLDPGFVPWLGTVVELRYE